MSMAKKPRRGAQMAQRMVVTKPAEFVMEDGLCAFRVKLDGEEAWLLFSPSVATRMVGLIQKQLAGTVLPWPAKAPPE